MYLTIVGRPNVGKSTLFNRLVRKKTALVFDRPGVTRDRREAEVSIEDTIFTLCDTAGIDSIEFYNFFKNKKRFLKKEPFNKEEGTSPSSLNSQDLQDSLKTATHRQIEKALTQATLILFVIDGRESLTIEDTRVADILRKLGKPVIVLVNKCEKKLHLWGMEEAHSLGFKEVVPISAEHGEGIAELYEKILHYKVKEEQPLSSSLDSLTEQDIILTSPEGGTEEGEGKELQHGPLKLTIVGRPNAGKSTLINALIGEERMVTSSEAGTTRDAISLPWTYKGKKIDLIDTAGLRRRSRIEDAVEKYAVQDTLKAIKYSEVVVLVVDAQIPLEKQDLTIASYTIEEGRALIIAVNKIDCIKNQKILHQQLRAKLEETLGQARGIEITFISAQKGIFLEDLMEKVFQVHAAWNKRVPTGILNRWLEEALTKHPPPLSVQGRRIRIKYMTQVKSRPPTFALFCSHPAALPLSYTRYLENSLRQWVDLSGVPLRFMMRGSKNPFATK